MSNLEQMDNSGQKPFLCTPGKPQVQPPTGATGSILGEGHSPTLQCTHRFLPFLFFPALLFPTRFFQQVITAEVDNLSFYF